MVLLVRVTPLSLSLSLSLCVCVCVCVRLSAWPRTSVSLFHGILFLFFSVFGKKTRKKPKEKMGEVSTRKTHAQRQYPFPFHSVDVFFGERRILGFFLPTEG